VCREPLLPVCGVARMKVLVPHEPLTIRLDKYVKEWSVLAVLMFAQKLLAADHICNGADSHEVIRAARFCDRIRLCTEEHNEIASSKVGAKPRTTDAPGGKAQVAQKVISRKERWVVTPIQTRTDLRV